MALVNLVLQLAALDLCYSCSQAVDDGCIKVPVMKDFDFRKITGNWYGQEIGDDDEAAMKCLRYSMKSNNYKSGANFTVQRLQRSDGTNPIFKGSQIGNTSGYRIPWRGHMRSGWVVGTDYKSWAAFYVCVPEENDKGALFIVTKDAVPSNATMEEAHNSVRKAGFKMDKSYLKAVDLSNCN